MKIFVFEFITGGGLIRDTLPACLVREGDLMLRSLVRDLIDVPGVQVAISRDPRLPALDEPVEQVRAGVADDPFVLYVRGVVDADAVWPVAPETGGVLERLCSLALARHKRVIGCSPQAVRVAASKQATSRGLERAGIATIPTYALPGEIPDLPGPWVIKPDDGVGCMDMHRVADARAARSWLNARAQEGFVAQPWIEGDALSLSLLCSGGRARLLACNRQCVVVQEGRLRLTGIEVNAVPDDGRYAALGARVAAALPGLWGPVGVDLVATASGPVVAEINPRLTTSYCGLRAALGINPAREILALAGLGAGECATAPRGAAVSLALDTADEQ